MFRQPRFASNTDRDIAALAAVLGHRDLNGRRGARAADALRIRAFDAGGATGLAWLESQLELIDPNLVEPLQQYYHPKAITVKTGGGFVEFISAFASNYASTGNQFYGLQGTANTDIPEIQADVQKGVWKTFNWASAMTLRYLDLQRLEASSRLGQPAPFSLQDLLKKACTANWNKALDYVTFKGFLGQPGIVNNPNVAEFVAPLGAGGSALWSKKTPQEILNDVNLALNTVASNVSYAIDGGMPNRMLIPFTHHAYITNPFTLSGVGNGFTSIKDYVEKNCVAAGATDFRIDRIPNPWISGQGASGTDRGVVYRDDEEDLYLQITQPMTQGMSVPTTRNGGSYETIYYGCVSQVIWKRTITATYIDGI